MSVKTDVLDYLDDHPDYPDPDESHTETARRLIDDGVTDGAERTVRRWVGRWTEGVDACESGDAGDGGCEGEPADSLVEEPPDEAVGLEVLDHDARYDDEGDYYECWIPYLGQPIKVSGDTARRIKRMYSNEVGKGETFSEIATKIGWNQTVLEQFKRAMDWVHSDTRYTDQEHRDVDTSDLVQSTISARKQEYITERNQELWKRIKADAQKWRDLKAGRLDPIADHVVDNPPARKVPQIEGDRRDYMAVLTPADLHFGKLGVDGYDMNEASRLVKRTTERILQRMVQHGRPDKIVVTMGHDWWHVDNPQGATTSGTPQDVDGLPRDIIGAGYDLAVEVIDLVRQFGPVEVRVVPSNHGEWSDYHTIHGLRLGYRNVSDVNVVCENSPRQYIEYGNCLVGLEHGDGARESDLPIIMANEQDQAWSECRWRYFLTGHKHHQYERDRGVVIMQAPSLSGEDRYHDKEGYVTSDRGNVAYLFDKERGHNDRMMEMVA